MLVATSIKWLLTHIEQYDINCVIVGPVGLIAIKLNDRRTSQLDCHKLSDRTPNSWMWITKSITCSQLLTRIIWSINGKLRSHVKFGLLWLDCDSQIRTKLANLWGIFDPILKNSLFDARSFRFKKESFWSQESSPWCICYQGSITSLEKLWHHPVVTYAGHYPDSNPL
jgi:hypothetical protein